MRRHVVISGTGRAGTTFLVALLTNLGFDTGFSEKEIERLKSETARAGLEHDIREEGSPYIIKSPWFCDYAGDVLARKDIVIEHVFIPVRDLDAAAESRKFVHRNTILKEKLWRRIKRKFFSTNVKGGLWHTNDYDKQKEVLLCQVYKLLMVLSNTNIPITIMNFPRIVKDSKYLYTKLSSILLDIDYEKFILSFKETVRIDLIHSFNENDI